MGNFDLKDYLTLVVVFMFACILLGFPLQFLWNTCLVGAIDGIYVIGFWQAIGLNVLSGILFKNFNNKK